MSSSHSQSENSQTALHVVAMEQIIGEYLGYKSQLSAVSYIHTFSDSTLESYCPEVVDLPAAFIIEEQENDTFIGIHISDDLYQILESHSDTSELLKSRVGLDAFLILAEEVSHFHYYLHRLDAHKQISRFDLELQAELDKIVITAITMAKLFGQPHLVELVEIVFNQSVVHGAVTDYHLVSKIAEKFWKENLSILGPRLIFDGRFRAHIHKASRISGSEKQRFLAEKIQAA
jgi:hypothetical protein